MNFSLSLFSLLWLIPIAVVICLDIKLVNYGILKEGWTRKLSLALSFILSLGAMGWGIWSIFNVFSLALLFVAGGGAILFLISMRSLLTDKEDLKHGR
jgi:hypothetical protein